MKISLDTRQISQFCDEQYEAESLQHSQLSILLKVQLLLLDIRGCSHHGLKRALFDIDRDVQLSSGMKRDSQFNHPPLKGLWKKHVYDLAYNAKNIKNELLDERSMTSQSIRDLFEQNAGASFQTIQHQFVEMIAFKAVENRRKFHGLTGEWLIYAKHEGTNYVLTLANHREGKNQKESDEHIYQRIWKSCQSEFPYLFPA